jgi:ubiquitin-conjugating enzyme E2 variant
MHRDQPREPDPGGGHRRLEIGAVAAVAAIGVAMASEIAAVAEPGTAWIAAAALLLSHPTADLVSGFVHWSADRVLSEQTPWLGPRFVRPFREHHDDPRGIVAHDFVETNGNTCIVLVPLLIAVSWLVAPETGDPVACFFQAFALGLAFWLILTNQFHKWAHAGHSTAAIRWLQRHRLVLEPAHHAVHHLPPYDRRFCITSGWCNGLLDALARAVRRRRAARTPGSSPPGTVAS